MTIPERRISYADLPSAVTAAIERVTGTPNGIAPVTDGWNHALAIILTSTTGTFFVKAMTANARSAWTQEREAQMATSVAAVAAAFRARVAARGWDVLIFDALPGRTADYRPESPDLPLVAGLLSRMSALPCPADVEVRDAVQRVRAFAAPGALHHFAGIALLHTDLNPANVIVHGEQARIVDWGWATRGAPWLDCGYWIIWLIAAGHHPRAAERWARTIEVWSSATPDGIDAFAAANARMWAGIGGSDPDPWTLKLVHASAAWHAYRVSAGRSL